MVKRYEFCNYDGTWEGCNCRMETDDEGDYVLHSDYAALEQERDELRAKLDEVLKGNKAFMEGLLRGEEGYEQDGESA